jgi:hypothetical protein
LHPAQDEAEHPPQPDEDEEDEEGSADPFPIPNFDSSLVVSDAPQLGHWISGFDPKTSFSKQHWHLLH